MAGNSIVVNVLAKVKGLDDVDAMKSKLTGLEKSKGFQSAVLGVGIAAGMAAWKALGMSVSAAVGWMQDAVQAAADDEVSQRRLYSAIAANVEAWDGNREAIEEVITARTELGFADDELRDSLTKLVAITGNVNEALDIQQSAMDIARMKGITLAGASDSVARALNGEGRALRDIGIDIRDYASDAEILAAIQEKAGGQALEWADTAQGSFVTLQITVDELQESVGQLAVGPMQDLATTLRDDVIPAVKSLDGALAEDSILLQNFRDLLYYPFDNTKLGRMIGEWLDPQRKAIRQTSDAAMEGAEAWDTLAEKTAAAREPIEGVTRVLSNFRPPTGPVIDVARAFERGRDAANEWRDAIDRAMDNITNRENDPAVLTLQVESLNEQLSQERAKLRDLERVKDPTAAVRQDMADTKLRIIELNDELRKTKMRLGLLNDTSVDDIAAALAFLKRNRIDPLSVGARELLRLLTRIGEIDYPTSGQLGDRYRASGGPVEAKRAYVVGEEGPELFVPATSGTIIPNRSAAMGAAPLGGGTDTPVNLAVYLDSEQIAARVERRQYFAASIAPVSAR